MAPNNMTRTNIPFFLAYATDIFESGDHLINVINDILDLSKIEAGESKLAESDIEIPEILGFSMKLIEGRATEKEHLVRIDTMVEGIKLRADERLVRQMLLNVLSNAVKFTDKGGEIKLAGEIGEHGSLRISVTDNGIGMKATDRETAIAKFGQIDSALDRRYEGTGLGLPLVKSLVELHGGGLEIDSLIGVGTTVTIWFPEERVIRCE